MIFAGQAVPRPPPPHRAPRRGTSPRPTGTGLTCKRSRLSGCLVAGAAGAALALRLLAGGSGPLVVRLVEPRALEAEGARAQDLLDLLPAIVLLERRIRHPLKHLEAAALGAVSFKGSGFYETD